MTEPQSPEAGLSWAREECQRGELIAAALVARGIVIERQIWDPTARCRTYIPVDPEFLYRALARHDVGWRIRITP